MTSELVAKAVLHGQPVVDGDIQLRLRHGPTRLRVEVVDGSTARPVIRPIAEGGRGLLLVEAIAARWGTIRDSAGKVVWFELDNPRHS